MEHRPEWGFESIHPVCRAAGMVGKSKRTGKAMTLSAPFTFSQSSLQDYTDCPRRFQLRYIDKVQWPAVETAPLLENERRQVEGQIFHRMAQQYFIGLPEEKITVLASTENRKRWWENFLTHGPKRTSRLNFTELSLGSRIGKHRIIAKYDLVVVKPEATITIYDWKTYHKRPKRIWMADRYQTRVYLSLLHRSREKFFTLGNPQLGNIEMIYWYAEFPGKPEIFNYQDTQASQTWKALEELVNEIDTKQSFPMTENENLCSFCVFRSYCDRGINAGEVDDIDIVPIIDDIDLEQIQEIEF
jgi:CRISPR/Cas system-associated exonuclease Cas4 (RecB family)